MPDDGNAETTLNILRSFLQGVRDREEKLKIDGNPAPPAYVFITNNSHEYGLNTAFRTWGVAEGYKIPDFHIDSQFTSLREALNAREKHIEIFSLVKSMREHYSIPSTFDGDNPELAFEGDKGRLESGTNTPFLMDKETSLKGSLPQQPCRSRRKLRSAR